MAETVNVSKSQVSREFILASEKQFKQLCERRFDQTDILAIYIDGSKALRCAINAVYGSKNPVQRCRNHKIRNVLGYQQLWILEAKLKDMAEDEMVDFQRQYNLKTWPHPWSGFLRTWLTIRTY